MVNVVIVNNEEVKSFLDDYELRAKASAKPREALLVLNLVSAVQRAIVRNDIMSAVKYTRDLERAYRDMVI